MPSRLAQQRRRRQSAARAPAASPPGAEPLVDKWGQPIEEGEIGIMSDDFYIEAGLPDGVEGKAGASRARPPRTSLARPCCSSTP